MAINVATEAAEVGKFDEHSQGRTVAVLAMALLTMALLTMALLAMACAHCGCANMAA